MRYFAIIIFLALGNCSYLVILILLAWFLGMWLRNRTVTFVNRSFVH